MRISDWSSDVCSSDLVSVSPGDRCDADVGYHLDCQRRSQNRASVGPGNIVGKKAQCDGCQTRSDKRDYLREEQMPICTIGEDGEHGDISFTNLRGSDHALDFGVISLSRSEEHTSELQSLMRISYAVFC